MRDQTSLPGPNCIQRMWDTFYWHFAYIEITFISFLFKMQQFYLFPCRKSGKMLDFILAISSSHLGNSPINPDTISLIETTAHFPCMSRTPSINADQTPAIGPKYLSMPIKRHWLAMISIDWHCDQYCNSPWAQLKLWASYEWVKNVSYTWVICQLYTSYLWVIW